MRALLVVLAGVALLIGVAAQPASAGKGTDFERFVKQIEKFVKDTGQVLDPKPKGLCVCQDGGADNALAGVLAYEDPNSGTNIRIGCWVRTFFPDGTKSAAIRCETFEVLSK